MRAYRVWYTVFDKLSFPKLDTMDVIAEDAKDALVMAQVKLDAVRAEDLRRSAELLKAYGHSDSEPFNEACDLAKRERTITRLAPLVRSTQPYPNDGYREAGWEDVPR